MTIMNSASPVLVSHHWPFLDTVHSFDECWGQEDSSKTGIVNHCCLHYSLPKNGDKELAHDARESKLSQLNHCIVASQPRYQIITVRATKTELTSFPSRFYFAARHFLERERGFFIFTERPRGRPRPARSLARSIEAAAALIFLFFFSVSGGGGLRPRPFSPRES